MKEILVRHWKHGLVGIIFLDLGQLWSDGVTGNDLEKESEPLKFKQINNQWTFLHCEEK